MESLIIIDYHTTRFFPNWDVWYDVIMIIDQNESVGYIKTHAQTEIGKWNWNHILVNSMQPNFSCDYWNATSLRTKLRGPI